MIKREINQVYRDFCERMNLSYRDSQLNGITFMLAPFYRDVTVIGEGQTGMGKTLAYLFPLVLQRMNRMPEIPSFLLKNGREHLWIADKTKEEILKEFLMGSGELMSMKELKEAEPLDRKRVIIVTATKMLQDQITRKDLKMINEYLEQNGKEPIRAEILIGTKNYVCQEKLQDQLKEIENMIEKMQEKDEQAPEDLLELRDVLKLLVEKNVQTTDEMLDLLGYERYQRVMEDLFEDYEIDYKAYSVVDALFEGTGKLKKIRCYECLRKENCLNGRKLSDVAKADVLIMNYYYYFYFVKKISILLNRLRSLERSIKLRLLEAGLGEKEVQELFSEIANEIRKREKEKKEAKEKEEERKGNWESWDIARKVVKELKEKGVVRGRTLERDIVDYINGRICYNMWRKETVYIFDEAHCFERDMLASLVINIDLKDMYEDISKLSEKLLKTEDKFFNLFVDQVRNEILRIHAKEFRHSVSRLSEYAVLLKKGIGEILEYYRNSYKEFSFEDIIKCFVSGLMKESLLNERLFELLRERPERSGKKKSEKESFETELQEEITRILQKKENSFADLVMMAYFLSSYFLTEVERMARTVMNIFSHLNKENSLRELTDQSSPIWKSIITGFPKGRVRKIAEETMILREIIATWIAREIERVRVMSPVQWLEIEKRCEKDKVWKEVMEWVQKIEKERSMKKRKVSNDGYDLYLVEGNLKEFLNNAYGNWESVPKIFVSATIGVPVIRNGKYQGVSFDYFAKSVGLNGTENAFLFLAESPFNFREQARMYIEETLPKIVEEGGLISEEWKEYVRKRLPEMIHYTRGGVLILTTSKEMQRFVYEVLKDEARKDPSIEIYCQGRHSVKKIRQEFGREEVLDQGKKQVLIGLQTFWQGFDMPGEKLTHVIIPKLPFEEPNSPYNVMVVEEEALRRVKWKKEYLEKKGIYVDTSELFEREKRKLFNEYVVPRAVLLFKQGVGRLIRSETDRGIVSVLDRRILDMGYGAFFLNAVNKIQVVKDQKSLAEFIKKIEFDKPSSFLRLINQKITGGKS